MWLVHIEEVKVNVYEFFGTGLGKVACEIRVLHGCLLSIYWRYGRHIMKGLSVMNAKEFGHT